MAMGFQAVLSHPKIYDAFQNLMGTPNMRRTLVSQFIRAKQGDCVLDVGCGTAEILDYLPSVDYVGFDVSEPYIKAARSRFDSRGQFFCRELTLEALESLPEFDLVLTVGLLHHLDDAYAIQLLTIIGSALAPGGRFISIDPVLDPEQSFIARFLVSHDRGDYVRTAEAYQGLVRSGAQFSQVQGQVWHRHCFPGVPYTSWIMECVA